MGKVSPAIFRLDVELGRALQAAKGLDVRARQLEPRLLEDGDNPIDDLACLLALRREACKRVGARLIETARTTA